MCLFFRQFNESEANKLGKPTNESFLGNAPYKPKDLTLEKPINLSNYIDQHLDEIK
jgi:ABC-type oligopeptide transport system substrate-binding subunit